ncbi:MAG: hypothetical protein R6X25_08905 [Candidatus Krumholzibacteriia bacterium]
MTIRISDSYMSKLMVNDLNSALGRLLQKQRQAGSMRRILSFADDPRAVAAIQRYSSLVAGNDQYLRNVSRARTLVDSTDSALQDMSATLAEVRELVLRESSAVATAESRRNATIAVDNLMDRLISTLNTAVEGNYIFGGHRTDAPPFVRTGDAVIYQGDGGDIVTPTGPGTDLTINIAGERFMGARSSVLPGGADMAPRLDAATALSDLNLGQGWTAGSIRIEDGTGASWTVDLSGANTVGDAMAAVAAATGGAVTLDVSADGSALQLTGNGPLTVAESGDGQTATSLGLRGTSASGTLTGRDVRPAVAPATPLASIESLAGRLPLGSIEITVAGTTTTVDLSSATTVADLQALISAAVPGMELRLQASSLDLVYGAPEMFTVVSAGGDTAAVLGLGGTGTPVRLFGLLEDLKADLLDGDPARIRGALTELAALEQVVQGEIIRTGGRQNDLDWIDGVLRQRDERLRTNLSLERDADMARVTTDLSRAETIYQASLLVTSKLFDQNLMMYLR